MSDQGTPISVDGFQLEHLGQAAREFIESGDPDQPYFLVFAPTDTHEPITGHPEDLVEKYRNADLGGVPVGETSMFRRRLSGSRGARRFQRDPGAILCGGQPPGRRIGADSRNWSKPAADLDNTLVIYTSDHGMMVGHHGLIGKSNATIPQNLYEESIRVPMILSWPAGVRRWPVSVLESAV